MQIPTGEDPWPRTEEYVRTCAMRRDVHVSLRVSQIMPYRRTYFPPEAFLTHKSVTVYRTYEEDDFDTPAEDLYTTDPTYTDCWCGEEPTVFNVRRLSTYKDTNTWQGIPGYERYEARQTEHKRAIIAAIDSGEIPCQ